MEAIKSRYDQYKVVFYKYYPSLYNYAYSILGNKELSEDIVQDSFLNVWEKKQDLLGINNIRFYLFSVVRNSCFSSLKNQQKRQIVEFNNISVAYENQELHPIINETEVDIEKLVGDALKRLPPKCKEVFLLSRIGNFSYKEIAETLSISVKTVENQMSKALKIIRIFAGEHNIYLILFYFLMAGSGN
ncbi:RNA polymerase sigma-70 factor [Parasediminibacterium paludis]|uniref:RNA polymerase sigma-70 factor n=1 Tax=Parasediminibacterium paludis TaxID=908966 RepID=A0ABV8PWP8_9BACT